MRASTGLPAGAWAMQLAPRNRRLGFVLAGLALLATPPAAQRRVALVIVNSAYQHTSPLPNPRHDAEDIDDKGMISRDAVLQDRAKYLANWPQRRFTLVPGSLQV